MKKPISIKLDEKLWVFIKNKPNKSRYIEELVKQDIQQAQVKPIVQSVIDELMRNEAFFAEMQNRLGIKTINHTPPKPEVFTPLPPDPQIGYPCCQGVKPCKHWVWDEVNVLWRNSLTQATREG